MFVAGLASRQEAVRRVRPASLMSPSFENDSSFNLRWVYCCIQLFEFRIEIETDSSLLDPGLAMKMRSAWLE